MCFPNYFMDFLSLHKIEEEDKVKKKEIQLCGQTDNAIVSPNKAR